MPRGRPKKIIEPEVKEVGSVIANTTVSKTVNEGAIPSQPEYSEADLKYIKDNNPDEYKRILAKK